MPTPSHPTPIPHASREEATAPPIPRPQLLEDILETRFAQTAETAALTDESRRCIGPKRVETPTLNAADFVVRNGSCSSRFTEPGFGLFLVVAELGSGDLFVNFRLGAEFLRCMPTAVDGTDPAILDAVRNARGLPFQCADVSTLGFQGVRCVGGGAAYFDGRTLFLTGWRSEFGEPTRRALELCLERIGVPIVYGTEISDAQEYFSDKGKALLARATLAQSFLLGAVTGRGMVPLDVVHKPLATFYPRFLMGFRYTRAGSEVMTADELDFVVSDLVEFTASGLSDRSLVDPDVARGALGQALRALVDIVRLEPAGLAEEVASFMRITDPTRFAGADPNVLSPVVIDALRDAAEQLVRRPHELYWETEFKPPDGLERCEVGKESCLVIEGVTAGIPVDPRRVELLGQLHVHCSTASAQIVDGHTDGGPEGGAHDSISLSTTIRADGSVGEVTVHFVPRTSGLLEFHVEAYAQLPTGPDRPSVPPAQLFAQFSVGIPVDQ